MRELLEKEQYKHIAEIVNKEIGELKRQSIYVESGYVGIDAIVNSKLMYAQGQGIHPIYNINIPKGLQIDNLLMSSILGNLLDNAIRATAQTEEKYFFPTNFQQISIEKSRQNPHDHQNAQHNTGC